MRLIDLDTLDLPGKTQIMKQLNKYQKEHPIKEIVVREDDEWIVMLKRKQKNS